MRKMARSGSNLSDLLGYLVTIKGGDATRVPALADLSQTLGISVATLREQLEAARLLGVVEVKPRAGIRKISYEFKPAALASLTYGLETGELSFKQLSEFRKHLEAAYFTEAAQLLTEKDLHELNAIVRNALQKLKFPAQLPVNEHRDFHLVIYRNLDNKLLNGILETYWELYHSMGYDIYPDRDYVERVWQYHARIVEQVQQRNFDQGLKLLLEHMDMMNQREKSIPRLSFE